MSVVESDCKLGCQWLKVVERAIPFRRVQVQQCLFITAGGYNCLLVIIIRVDPYYVCRELELRRYI